MAGAAEVAAHSGDVPHAQSALGGAAQVGRQAAIALQDRVVDTVPTVGAGVSGSRKTARPPGRSTWA